MAFVEKNMWQKSQLNETLQNIFKKQFRLLQARADLKGRY